MPELKQEIRLWVSSGCGNQKNCRYPYEKVVSTTEDLKTAVAFDHTFISFKSNYRNEDNFEFADALAVDCDNGHTDEKDKWIRSDDIAMAFPDVSFVIYTSRNHMKDKGSSVARPRFHVIFFIDRITSAADYKALLKRVQDYFPYFDTKALDAARFFYGNADCEITVQEGNTNLTQFFSEEDAFANMGEEIQEGSRNASMFKWAVRSMKRYGNTEESKKCFYLQAEKCNPPLDDEELQTIWRSAARYYKKIASQPDYVPPQEYNNPGPTKWVEPIPFRKYKMEEFPVDALPADLADYVIEASESTQTPVDMAGTVAISMLSTCEQGKILVEGKPDWREPGNTYAEIILPPSERKSAILNAMTPPINKYEIQYNNRNAAALEANKMENELMLSIMSSIAESESVSISENNKWSIQRKFKNGTYKCSYPPYGYDWDKKNGEMVVNPEQAEIVRYIFAQTLAGVGTHDIAKDLMAKGVPTKKGGKWTGHTVNGIIRNEKYTGDCLFQKTYTDSSFVRRRNLGELDQYYVEDHHEAIISREDYEAANDVIDRRRQEKGIELDNGKYQNRYPLSGKVICGECGGTFKRKTYTHKVVLACTQHIDDKEKCSMKYVDLEAVEVAFATMMNRLVYGRNKVLRPFYEALQQSNQTEALLKIHDIQEQLDALVEKKQTIKGLFAKGVIEPAVYTQSLNGVTAEVERLTTEKDALSYIASSEISHIEETRKLLSFADKEEFLDGFDGEIFETYVDRIVVKSQTELEFQMKCGLNLIERI